MSEESKVVAYERKESGSAAARRLRRDGWLPAVMNMESGESRPLRISRHDFEVMLHHHTSESLVLDLAIEGDKPRKVLLKDVQHDTLSGRVLHADLLEISMTKTMRVSVPIHLTGDPVGVTQDEGVLDHHLRELEIECLPSDLAERIEADVSGLKIGDALQVADLNIRSGWTVMTAGDVVVASVLAPRLVEEEAATEEEAAEGAEPEVIGEEKSEEEKARDGAEEEQGGK